MKKYIAQITILGLLTSGLFVVPVAGRAQDAQNNTPSTSDQSTTPKAKHKTIPFHGKISGVDTSAMTLKVGNRTFQVTSETKVFKDGKPAALSDAVAGEQVRGIYQKTESGTLEVVSMHLGAKNVEKPKRPSSNE